MCQCEKTLAMIFRFVVPPPAQDATSYSPLRGARANTGPITHDRNTGLLNTNLSMPFKALGGKNMLESKMVRPRCTDVFEHR